MTTMLAEWTLREPPGTRAMLASLRRVTLIQARGLTPFE